jgi:hypothetical protein
MGNIGAAIRTDIPKLAVFTDVDLIFVDGPEFLEACVAHDLLFQNGTHARCGDWSIHQPVQI